MVDKVKTDQKKLDELKKEMSILGYYSIVSDANAAEIVKEEIELLNKYKKSLDDIMIDFRANKTKTAKQLIKQLLKEINYDFKRIDKKFGKGTELWGGEIYSSIVNALKKKRENYASYSIGIGIISKGCDEKISCLNDFYVCAIKNVERKLQNRSKYENDISIDAERWEKAIKDFYKVYEFDFKKVNNFLQKEENKQEIKSTVQLNAQEKDKESKEHKLNENDIEAETKKRKSSKLAGHYDDAKEEVKAKYDKIMKKSFTSTLNKMSNEEIACLNKIYQDRVANIDKSYLTEKDAVVIATAKKISNRYNKLARTGVELNPTLDEGARSKAEKIINKKL